MTLSLDTFKATQFLRRSPGGELLQLVGLEITNRSQPLDVRASLHWPDGEETLPLGRVPSGPSSHELCIREHAVPCSLRVGIRGDKAVLAEQRYDWVPPRHWRVHVVHLSHHDVGYTDLASNVVPQHVAFLDEAIDFADSTHDYPDDARFRIVIEQAWSLAAFLRCARADRRSRMVELLREGRFELTALFGNMVTETCGHESLVRALYPSYRIAREAGVEIVSAEHNDITGFGWGLCQALTGAGVKLLCAGLPQYYRWGGDHPSFWDAAALFGQDNVPGLLWWEAPAAGRLLLWHGDMGCGGDCRLAMPGLANRLEQLATSSYPLDTIRWVVTGAARDNSPYLRGYADTVREWNERWAYPHLTLSTNTRFLADIADRIPADTPVVRGGLPGQDYPAGVLSTSEPTAANRENHEALPASEKLAAAASLLTGAPWPEATLDKAWEHVLWYDEHTWGHHFPAGPTARAARNEKASHACQAAALAHDVREKAMARIADSIAIDGEDVHLVVYNPEPYERTDTVSCPMREIDNCGNALFSISQDDDPKKCGYLRGVLLGERFHLNPPPDIVEGRFDLVDIETGERVPWQLDQIGSCLGGEAYAPERTGLGAGGKRLGFFEPPAGLGRNLTFVAERVPATGYRTYRLVPRKRRPRFARRVTASRFTIDNDSCRVEVDRSTGCIASILDKQSNRELVDADAPHGMGAFVVRDPAGREWTARPRRVALERRGPLVACLRIESSVHGHPRIETRVSLTGGIERIDVSVHVLKDPTPLLEAFVAFPFLAPGGRFTCVEPLCMTDPVRDRLPGAFLDRLCVDDGVVVSAEGFSIGWRPGDTPVVSLGQLWPGRISPAHACVPHDLDRQPQSDSDIHTGHLYSCLFANNFGTNFAVSQTGEVLFRYRIAARAGSDGVGALANALAAAPLSIIFTERRRAGTLPPVGTVLSIDNRFVRLLAVKRAENGEGYVARLLNLTGEKQVARMALAGTEVKEVERCRVTEDGPVGGKGGLDIELRPRELLTVRLRV